MSDAPQAELVDVTSLKPHPKNYRVHPEEQLEHLMQSIREHGFYRNIVVARDNTILAGHGVVEAVRRLGMFAPQVPVIRVDVDPNDPKALKILTGDNEIGKLAELGDRQLTEILKDLAADGGDLLGTGFDLSSLQALVFVSRPVEEVQDKDEAAEWIGMPEYDSGTFMPRVTVYFRNAEDRDSFVQQSGLQINRRQKEKSLSPIWSAWWPPQQRMDRQEVLFAEDVDKGEGQA